LTDFTSRPDFTEFNRHSIPIVFYAFSLNDFDLFTVQGVNRMKMAIDYFAFVRDLPAFAQSSFVFVFTKMDLFKKKIKTTSFRQFFPDYKGADDDVMAIRRYTVELLSDNYKICGHFK
jgi:hypothetical protein